MDVEYTNDEIRKELARLGYHKVTDEQLKLFTKRLAELIHAEKSEKPSLKSVASSSFSSNGNSGVYQGPTNNHRKEQPYRSASSLYGYHSAGDNPFSADNYQLSYDHSDIKVDKKRKGTRVRILSPNINHGSPEPSLKPKTVKWTVPWEAVHVSFEGDTTLDRKYPFDKTGQFDEALYKTRGLVRWDDSCEDSPAESEDSEEWSGQKTVPKSIPGIIMRKEHPHTRNLFRTKPFERHQWYLKVWKAQPPVGEACRHGICWQVHKKLLKNEKIMFPQKTMTPNSYIIPTTKPRYELRWAVRQCNENYEMPPCGFFQEM